MEDKNIETNTMTPRKILIPIKDQQPESPRPTMKLNTYNDEITTPTRSDTMTNKTNDEMKNKFDALMGNFTKKFISTTANNSELPVIKAPAVEQSSAQFQNSKTHDQQVDRQGTRFFKFPTTDHQSVVNRIFSTEESSYVRHHPSKGIRISVCSICRLASQWC